MDRSNKIRFAVRKYEPFENAIRKAWDGYCKLTGCKMELEMVPLDLHPLHETILENEGLKNGDWDIAHMNTDWIAEAYEAKAIEKLDDRIASNPPEGGMEAWADSLLSMQKFNGEVYGLPFHNGPECLIYRKDLFEDEQEKAGFKARFNRELTLPKNWDELIDVATFFYRPKQNLYGTTFAAYPDGHNTVFDFCLQLWSRGGELVNESGKINVSSDEAVKGMEFYRKAIKNKEAIHPQSFEFDSVKAGMAFSRGELAMMVNWFGFASMCETFEESKVKGKVNIASVPAGVDGKEVSLLAYWLYVVGTGSKNKEVAYDFIRYAVSKENDKQLTLEGGIGCRKSTWYDKEVNEIVPYYSSLDKLHDGAKALPRMSNWTKIADVIDHLVLDVMNTEKPIKDILEAAQDGIDKITEGK